MSQPGDALHDSIFARARGPVTAGVTMDSSGNLYGTTISGGAYGYGVVFEYTP